MKLVTFARRSKPSQSQVGILEGETIFTIENWQGDMRELIAYGITPKKTGKLIKRDEVIIQAPIHPNKIVAVGRNYAEHAAELGNEVPSEPLLFVKLTTALIGDGQTIRWSRSIANEVDWEGELAVIIGRTGWNIPEAEAMEYVFGYTVANDVSARDLQQKDKQWIRAKGMDTFGPMGPHIITADAVPDPHNLTIQTRVNGDLMQNSTTSLMIYRIPFLIAHCSHAFTLEAGDVLLTGTPSGVGKGMTPPRFLGEGDVVTVTIEGIGEISNPCEVDA
jgi:5-carboxymethyl-2-hydroxymuconate isomerase